MNNTSNRSASRTISNHLKFVFASKTSMDLSAKKAFKSLFGWDPPRELSYWLAIKDWNRWKFCDAEQESLWNNLRADAREISKILKTADKPNTVMSKLFNWDFAFTLLTGVLPTTFSSDNDMLDCSFDADRDYCHVYNFDHGQFDRLIAGSLLGRTYKRILESQETYYDYTESDSRILKEVARRDRELDELTQCHAPRKKLMISRFKRMAWIRYLCEKHFDADVVKMSPNYSQWLKERDTVAINPFHLNYWLLAHALFGNIQDCKTLIDIGKKAKGIITQQLAIEVEKLINGKKARLGEISTHFEGWRSLIDQYIPATYFNPEVRKKINAGRRKYSKFFSAVKSGDLSAVQKMLREIGVNDVHDNTIPITVAAEANQYGMAKLLIEHQSIITPHSLYYAVHHENIDLLELLLDHAKNRTNALNCVAFVGRPILYSAIEENKPAMAEYLLRQGANANIMTYFGTSPLMAAALIDNKVLFQMLIDYKADPLLVDDNNSNTVVACAAEKSPDCLRTLLANGVDPNFRKQQDDDTPLIVAVSKNQLDCVKQLLKHDADVNLIGDYTTALVTAIDNDSYSMVELLIKHGADVNRGNRSGVTPLHRAALFNNPKIIHLLLEKGADVNVADSENDTPLSYAVSQSCSNTVQMLLDRGARADVKVRFGETTLYCAEREGDEDVIRLIKAALVPD